MHSRQITLDDPRLFRDPDDRAEMAHALERLKTALHAEETGPAIGFAVQRAMLAINQALLLGNVMCDDGGPGEKPSVMDAHYRDGAVTFRCHHDPTHEFTIPVNGP